MGAAWMTRADDTTWLGWVGKNNVLLALAELEAAAGLAFAVEWTRRPFFLRGAQPNVDRWLDGLGSHWRDCHFADALSPSLLKQLLKGEGGAAE